LAPSAATSKPSARQARVIAAAWSAGTSPARASARASAASKSSVACSQAPSPTASRTGPRASTPSKSSGIEEGGLPLALQADVEAQPVALRDRHQRGAYRRVAKSEQQRVGRVGRRLVGEVEARDRAPEQ